MPIQVVFLVLAGWLMLAMSGIANAVPLSALLAGHSIAVGNKVFDQWSLLSYESSDRSRIFNPANIHVTAFDVDTEESGLNFVISRGDLGVRGDGAGAFVDLTFGYRLSALDPAHRITEGSLWLTAGSLSYTNDRSSDNGIRVRANAGSGLATDDLGSMLAELSVRDANLVADLGDLTSFASHSDVWITTNVSVWARDRGDKSTLAGFSQRFLATAVPEPGTAVLVGLALFGLILGRRNARWWQSRS